MRSQKKPHKAKEEPGCVGSNDPTQGCSKRRNRLLSLSAQFLLQGRQKHLSTLFRLAKPVSGSSTGRQRFWAYRACDEASGTVSGVMLIAVAAVLMSAIALGGNLLVCISQARSAADQSAIAGAQSARDGDYDPCLKSRLASSLNKASLTTCKVDQEDVTVKVAVRTSVPFVPLVSRMARAGPVECS
ncbi:Rv3654c family TadE-like protein [Bifidobacterium sp. ESL0745]|uniref:Rv3654c family TadE-like protein n=1 Tax=Bifidobacterium sp. ESL0745 TaxID=2983226 RepID=UPI0023F6D313|nr:Rv3654c family TadE-like protein [Bifidobacterium sp. ESL0745]MDF7664534.1 flp pilus-assembly TadE/G-like family protein [Bifidobacterium sp. ESL0745]